MNDLGTRIKSIREKRRITKSELARLIDVSPAYITMLENGSKKNPSIDILKKIAKILKVPLSELINDMKYDVTCRLNRNIDFKIIKKYREEMNLSQENLSELIDIKLETLKGIEAGTIPNPRIDYAIKLNSLFNPNPPFCYYEEKSDYLFNGPGRLSNAISNATECYRNTDINDYSLESLQKDKPNFKSIKEYEENSFLYWKDVVTEYPIKKIDKFNLNSLSDDEITEIATFLDLAFKTKIAEIKNKRTKIDSYKKLLGDSKNEF